MTPLPRAADLADVGFVEADGEAVAGAQKHVLLAVGHLGRDKLVALFKGDGDDARRPGVAVGLELGLLDDALLRGHEDEVVRREFTHRQRRRYPLVRADLEQVHDGLALGLPARLGEPDAP